MDDFKFSAALKKYFNTEEGAGSRVTLKDEAKKKQLTLPKTGFEREIVTKFYQNVPIGSKKSLGEQCLFDFYVYPTGQKIRLPMVFRPDDLVGGRKRDELRLYMNKGLFWPAVHTKWFVFKRDNKLWIGALTDDEIDAIENGFEVDTQDGLTNISEETFQEIVNSGKIPKLITIKTTSYQRDPSIGVEALNKSKYVCEMFPNKETFISKGTGKPYLEAHHLVPMFWQRHIPNLNIDDTENICILNPYSHKMIHHGRFDDIAPEIQKMAHRRQSFLKKIGMNVENVMNIYSGLSK
jgi:5-methylcytosine-specific restriction enzyme A